MNLFENSNHNQILAVTVNNRQMEKSTLPEKWEEARQKEMESLRHHKVFEVVDRQEIPNDHPNPISCRWLYTLKE